MPRLPRPRTARPSYRSRATIWLSLALAVLAACDGEPEQPTPVDEPAPEPSEPVALEDAWSVPVERLREEVTSLSAEAARLAGEEAGVERATRAATLARVLSIRDPSGADWTARSRAWLTEASRRREVAGACDAALALAELEARDAVDLEAAYRVAFRATLRFGGRDDDCVARAQTMLTYLEPWRPEAGVLAAIRADPDSDDPSVRDDAEPTNPLERWAAQNAAEGERAMLESLTVYAHGASDEEDVAAVRFVLRLDRVVAYEHGEAPAEGDRPRRTWFELASVGPGPSVASAVPVDAGGVTRVRTQAREGGTRVTFDLEEDARFRSFVLDDPFRLVLDVERAGAHAEGPVRTILLDPGHGGDDFGARAFGLRESDLVLDIGQRVKESLRRRMPEVRVLMTRETDDFVSLEQRTAMANSVGADVFLSLHLNAADEPVSRGGVTTFVLDTSDDRQAARLAARENGTPVGQVDSLSRLLASMHRTEQLAASRALAEQVHRTTLAAGRERLPTLHDRGVRSALFYVLVGARMPAVLLEASFLSREDEAERLRTVEYRQALAEGIAEGVARWAGR